MVFTRKACYGIEPGTVHSLWCLNQVSLLFLIAVLKQVKFSINLSTCFDEMGLILHLINIYLMFHIKCINNIPI